MPSQARQIVFVHLPKTGGFALHAVLERSLPPGQVLRVGDAAAQDAFRAMLPEEAERYAVLSGHFTLDEALSRARPQARFATVLRDPVARLLSAFNYMATWTGHPLHEIIRQRSFAQFIADSGDELRGEACRQLTGRSTAAEAIPILESCYAVVGTTSRLADVSMILHDWLGLPRQVPARENVTEGQGRIALTSEICEALLSLTYEDRLLYQHVLRGHGGLMLHPGVAFAG